jgi:hypothetical protein
LGRRSPERAANRCAGEKSEQPSDNTAGQFAPNTFIRINQSGKITLVMPQVEMGQGVYTAMIRVKFSMSIPLISTKCSNSQRQLAHPK